MSDAAVIRAEDVWKVFRKDGHDVKVLKGISFAIARGETVGMVGVSGAGKTTLLQILGTLDRPTSGSILFEGEDLAGYSEERLAGIRNRKIGFVFQFHNLLPEFTVLENVMLPCRIAGKDLEESRGRAESLLSEVGLSHRLSHRAGEISGGEQQRAAVCRALVMEPAVLLADEPTGNLDRGTATELVELLLEINRERKLSLLMVTHNEQAASRLHRVVRIDDGRIAQ